MLVADQADGLKCQNVRSSRYLPHFLSAHLWPASAREGRVATGESLCCKRSC